VYGERQRPDLAIHKFVLLIMNGQPVTIYGDGETARDYTYYADTVSGIIEAIEYIQNNNGVWETFNLGNHTPVSLKDLIKAISEAAGIEPRLVYEKMKPGDVNITYASIDKAMKVLNYHPRTSLKEGLGNFISWYKSQHAQETVK
jgi:nucleoside-diphosphate-sugar epimerase